ncbi:hypothetical protein GX51_07582 [Blastomyces parvus]|uniref:Uncharacterized protein n=1 Tax=Blastomyces parvus TaxID=2060905 RepID=A0A2B7WJX5_9EURO|nr:hypothetical protein GX51_07582 [Blastomyces parvus]
MAQPVQLDRCYEFRLIQTLGRLLAGRYVACPRPMADPCPPDWYFECEVLRALELRKKNLVFSPACFDSVQENFVAVCKLLDRLVQPSIRGRYAVQDPECAYPNLLALKTFMESPSRSRIFGLISGPNIELFKLPQDSDEMLAELDSLTVANDGLSSAFGNALKIPPATTPQDTMDLPVFQDTTTRDRVAVVLKALFQNFRCKSHEVRLGLPDSSSTGASQQRIHLWLSLCLDSDNWQEALCGPHEDEGLFKCTENICNQLQDCSNRGKRLNLAIKSEDEVLGTWNSTLSNISADPSSSTSLEQMIHSAPEKKGILYRRKLLLALRLGYYLLDFYDTEWDSKHIHFMECVESDNQDVLLYLSFSSALPASRELLTFDIGHPVLMSFAKILLEIYTAQGLSVRISQCDRKENIKSFGEMRRLTENLAEPKPAHDASFPCMSDYYYFEAVNGCLEVHNHIDRALKRNTLGREMAIVIREHIYKKVVGNLELATEYTWPVSARKRRRSDSTLQDTSLGHEAGASRARNQNAALDLRSGRPSVQKDVGSVSDRELVALPPQKKKRLANSCGELVLNHLTCNSNPNTSASPVLFLSIVPETFADQNSVHRESAHRMKWLASIQGKLLLSKTPREDTETVRIAIIDTGIDISHPFISNGYGPKGDEPASVKFHDFTERASSTPIDEEGHGTFIAGIILQLVPNVDLFVARVGQTRNSLAGDLSADVKVAKAIEKAVEWGADIMSMSFGFDRKTEYLEKAINLATSKQIIILAAAGNSGNHQQPQYPADEDRVFKIFVTDHLGYKADSCPPLTDPRYSFGALGSDIESIWPLRIEPPAVSTRSTTDAPWTRMSGSSFSTPVAAAIVAIIFQFYYECDRVIDVGEKFPDLKTIHAVRAILESMSRKSEDHKYNYLMPDIGSDNYNLEAERLKDNYGNSWLAHYFALKIREAVQW